MLIVVCMLCAHQQSKVVYSSNNRQLPLPSLIANNVVQSSINDRLVNQLSAWCLLWKDIIHIRRKVVILYTHLSFIYYTYILMSYLCRS